jgi:hypothetical protein
MYQTNDGRERVSFPDAVVDGDRATEDIDGWVGKRTVTLKAAAATATKEMRIPDIARNAVVYLGRPLLPDGFKAVGTGFLVEHRRDSGVIVQYLVTADHVRRALGKSPQFAIRVNDGTGKARTIPSPTWLQWFTHKTDKTIDAAIYPWRLRPERFPYKLFPTTRFVDERYFAPVGFGPGDETYIVGLFRNWAGKEGISPIVRMGHIAMVAGERISTPNYGDAFVHLVEAFTLKGLSGSPVFVRETIGCPVQGTGVVQQNEMLGLGSATYLLGLVHAFMPVMAADEVGDPDLGQKWHSGISMIVPASEILKILNQPEVIEYESTMLWRMDNKKIMPVETAIDEETTSAKPKRKNRDVKIPPISREKFLDALGKATSRRGKK